MLSSIGSYFSPKARIAWYLSSSLAAFFEVDPNSIETNLIKDTKIVLKSVGLRPQFHGHAVLTGSVEEIHFVWTWGGSGQTSFIRDTSLTIIGAKFKIEFCPSPTLPSHTHRCTPQSVPPSSSFGRPTSSERAQSRGEPSPASTNVYLQQIVDHLTLNITDVQFTVEPPPAPQDAKAMDATAPANETTERGESKKSLEVLLRGRSVRLVSHGRRTSGVPMSEIKDDEPAPPLFQRISFASFEVVVVETTEDNIALRNTYSLIEPFTYQAKVTRVAGKRFLSGLGSGLVVFGEQDTSSPQLGGEDELSPKNGDSIVICVGLVQMEALCRLNEALEQLSFDQEKVERSRDFLDGGTPADTRHKQEDSNVEDDENSSMFILPISSISLVLPNSTRITAPACMITYRTDGQIFNAEGKKGAGILLDDAPFVELDEDCGWCVDLVHPSFKLEDRGSVEKCGASRGEEPRRAALIHVHQDYMKKCFEGINGLIAGGFLPNADASSPGDRINSPADPSLCWSVETCGSVEIRMESSVDGAWVNARFDATTAVMSRDSSGSYHLNEMKCRGVTLGPSSSGHFSVVVPPLFLLPDQKEFCVDGSIAISFHSAAVFEDIQRIISEAFPAGQIQSSSFPKQYNGQGFFPNVIVMPKVGLEVLDPKTSATADNIRLDGRDVVTCAFLRCTAAGGTTAAVSGLKASLTPTMRVEAALVEELNILGVVRLAKPMHDTTVSFEAGTLEVKTVCIEAFLLESETETNSNGNEHIESGADVPVSFPIHFLLEEVRLMKTDVDNWWVRLCSLDISVEPIGSSISVVSNNTVCVRMENSNTKWIEAVIGSATAVLSPVTNSGGYIPSRLMCSASRLGPYSGGELSVSVPCVCLQGNEICVDESLDISLLSVALLQDIQVLLAETLLCDVIGAPTPSGASSSTGFLPFPMVVPKITLNVLEPKTKFRVEGVRLDGFVVSCASVRCAEASGVLVSASGLRATLQPNKKMELALVEELHFPGVLSLAKPIRDTTLSFEDDTLEVKSTHVRALLWSGEKIPSDKNTGSGNVSIPCPIRFLANEVRLGKHDENVLWTCFNSVDIRIIPSSASLSIESMGFVRVRVENAQEWIEATIDSTSVVLSRDPASGMYTPSQIMCSSSRLGPCSYGELSVSVPCISLEKEELSVGGSINISLQSVGLVQDFQGFLKKPVALDVAGASSPSGAGKFTDFLPFPMVAPEVNIEVLQPKTLVRVEEVHLVGNSISVGSVQYTDASGVSVLVSRLNATLEPYAELKLGLIEELHVPGVCHLTKPIQDTRASFEKDFLDVKTTFVQLLVLHGGMRPNNSNERNVSDTALWIPFPMRLIVPELRLTKPDESNSWTSVHSIDIFLKPVGSALSVESRGTVGIRVENSENKWIEANVESTSALLSRDEVSGEYMPSRITCAGSSVGPCSYGRLSGRIPLVTLIQGREELCVDGGIDILLGSPELFEETQALLFQALPIMVADTSPEESDSTSGLPFPAVAPKVNIELIKPRTQVQIDRVHVDGFDINCNSIRLADSCGVTASITGLSASLKPNIKVELATVNSLNMPGVFNLSQPLHHTTLSFEGDTLVVKINSAQASVLYEEMQSPEKCETSSNADSLIPVPFRLSVQELTLTKPGENSCIRVRPIDVRIKQIGSSISVESHAFVSIRLENSQKKWLEANIQPVSAVFSRVGPCDAFSPSHITCAGWSLGPCSYGQLSLCVPPMVLLPGNSDLNIDGRVEISLQSAEVADDTQRLLKEVLSLNEAEPPAPNSSQGLPFQIVVPNLKILVLEPSSLLFADGICFDGFNVSCESMLLNETGTGASASISGLRALIPKTKLDIALVEELHIPGIIRLSKPLKDTTMSFEGETLHVNVTAVQASILGKEGSSGVPPNSSSSAEVTLPFPIRFLAQELSLMEANAESRLAVLRHVDVGVKPVVGDRLAVATPGIGLTVHNISQVENEMVEVRDVKASAFIFLNTMDTVNDFSFAASGARINAGFSSVDWSEMFGKGNGDDNKVVVIKMPFASIAGLNLRLSYKGTLVSTKETGVDIAPFVGGADTDSKKIIDHYKNAVLSRFPSIVSNTEIMGANVVDSTFTNAGRMAMRASVSGSAMGSVVGVAAVDGVKGAIAKGKTSRNVSTDAGYKFGDFTRGTIASLKGATKSPSRATSAVGTYVGTNKSRLGAAGGGGAGMAVGTALLGPVGFVAGSYFGSKMGEKVFKDGVAEEDTGWIQAGMKLGPSEDFMVKAKKPFNGRDTAHLSFPALATIRARPGHKGSTSIMWWGSYGGREGWFPTAYVTPFHSKPDLLFQESSSLIGAPGDYARLTQRNVVDPMNGRSSPTNQTMDANSDFNRAALLHMYKATCSFDGEVAQNQLSFPYGAVIAARPGQASSGWWWGAHEGREGWFPPAYVTPISAPPPVSNAGDPGISRNSVTVALHDTSGGKRGNDEALLEFVSLPSTVARTEAVENATPSQPFSTFDQQGKSSAPVAPTGTIGYGCVNAGGTKQGGSGDDFFDTFFADSSTEGLSNQNTQRSSSSSLPLAQVGTLHVSGGAKAMVSSRVNNSAARSDSISRPGANNLGPIVAEGPGPDITSTSTGYLSSQSQEVTGQRSRDALLGRDHNKDSEQVGGYKFGDFTRGMIAKGKKKDGRSEKSGYKFGDFTRGLLG